LATGQTIFDKHLIARAATAATCLMLLSGCVTHAAKDKQLADVAEASEPVPVVVRTPGEQLAAELNAKAQLQAQKQSQKPGQYRDPQVRTASGQQMVAQQSATGLYPAPPQAQVPASAAMAPANIGGLVTQPTAVNANRSSIYAAPAPIAVNPDGTLAPISAYATPGAAPSLRSVYSLPPGTLPEQPQAVILPPQPVTMPSQPNQTVKGAMPHYAPKIASTSVGRPTSDATPSRILPAPGSTGRHLDSAEALMMARNMASGGQNPPANTMMPQASSGLTLPQGVSLPPGVTLTPGVAASLK
jgi:hypothetical protein